MMNNYVFSLEEIQLYEDYIQTNKGTYDPDRGIITINPRIMESKEDCINIIIHELTHALYFILQTDDYVTRCLHEEQLPRIFETYAVTIVDLARKKLEGVHSEELDNYT